MNYTLVTRLRISPKYITKKTVNGADELRLNPIPAVTKPNTFGNLIYSPMTTNQNIIYDGYVVELWEDTSGTATLTQVDTLCAGFRLWKEKLIRAEGQVKLNAIASPYTPSERETWPYQREECLAYNRDNTSLTPFCDIIAQSRGIPRALFLAKVKENMDLFSIASATILGQQQALIDQVYTATTIDSVLGVKWL